MGFNEFVQTLLTDKPATEERQLLGMTVEEQARTFGKKFKDDPSDILDNIIKKNEGFRSSPYLDTKGKSTIGYGFNISDETVRQLIPQDVLSGKRELSKDESDEIFGKLKQRAIGDAQTFVGRDTFGKLTSSQQIGLTDMAYNMGLKSLNKFNNLREALINGDKIGAKREVLDSKYAEDVPSRALNNANLMLK